MLDEGPAPVRSLPASAAAVKRAAPVVVAPAAPAAPPSATRTQQQHAPEPSIEEPVADTGPLAAPTTYKYGSMRGGLGQGPSAPVTRRPAAGGSRARGLVADPDPALLSDFGLIAAPSSFTRPAVAASQTTGRGPAVPRASPTASHDAGPLAAPTEYARSPVSGSEPERQLLDAPTADNSQQALALMDVPPEYGQRSSRDPAQLEVRCVGAARCGLMRYRCRWSWSRRLPEPEAGAACSPAAACPRLKSNAHEAVRWQLTAALTRNGKRVEFDTDFSLLD